MISDQESRLVTVVTLWNGEGRLKRCDENARWVRPLLAPYVSAWHSGLLGKHRKNNASDRRVESPGLGGLDTMLRKRNCRMDSCSGASVTSLDQQDLCLNHFLLRCYEKLEGVDPRNRKLCPDPLELASLRGFVEECSRKTLDLSLHCENLTNLQRGRLLDILLWAGELFFLLRAPRLTTWESHNLGRLQRVVNRAGLEPASR